MILFGNPAIKGEKGDAPSRPRWLWKYKSMFLTYLWNGINMVWMKPFKSGLAFLQVLHSKDIERVSPVGLEINLKTY